MSPFSTASGTWSFDLGKRYMQAGIHEQGGMLLQFLPFSGPDVPVTAEPLVRPAALPPCNVLIVEGNEALARLLATGLLAESFSVEVTSDPLSLMRKFGNTSHNLLIVDMKLLGSDSLTLLQDFRNRQPDIRIVALGGTPGVQGLVDALDHGADDYLPKPFSLLELVARVRALRRRPQASTNLPARATSVVLHKDRCQVERDGRFIDLTPRECLLLECLMRNVGKTLSRATLTQDVWHMPPEGNTNIVDVYVKYLRDKIDGDFDVKVIRTVRGIGYVFQLQP